MGRVEVTDETISAFAEAWDREGQGATGTLAGLRAVLDIVERDQRPRRGDDVERWLTQTRDELAPSPACAVIDDLLAHYQQAADTGTPLSRDAD